MLHLAWCLFHLLTSHTVQNLSDSFHDDYYCFGYCCFVIVVVLTTVSAMFFHCAGDVAVICQHDLSIWVTTKTKVSLTEITTQRMNWIIMCFTFHHMN